MSLDIDFCHINPCFDNTCDEFEDQYITDATYNITHNLNIMAEHVPLSNGFNLYDILWCGGEITPKISKADQLTSLLIEGLKYMVDHEDELLQYNASNGWGNYNDLLAFVSECLIASFKYPNDKVIYSK